MEREGRSNEHREDRVSKCLSCKHLIEWPYCLAFLTGEGIPEDIRSGQADHGMPYLGDHGIVYTALSSPYELSEEGLRWLIAEYKGLNIMPHSPIRESIAQPLPLQREEAAVSDSEADYPPLIASAASGDLGRVRDLLEGGANVNVQDADGTTALMSACRNCDLQMVELLLRYGADVNLEDNSSRTPLYIAGAWGYPTIAELLKLHGAVETKLPGA